MKNPKKKRKSSCSVAGGSSEVSIDSSSDIDSVNENNKLV